MFVFIVIFYDVVSDWNFYIISYDLNDDQIQYPPVILFLDGAIIGFSGLLLLVGAIIGAIIGIVVSLLFGCAIIGWTCCGVVVGYGRSSVHRPFG